MATIEFIFYSKYINFLTIFHAGIVNFLFLVSDFDLKTKYCTTIKVCYVSTLLCMANGCLSKGECSSSCLLKQLLGHSYLQKKISQFSSQHVNVYHLFQSQILQRKNHSKIVQLMNDDTAVHENECFPHGVTGAIVSVGRSGRVM